MQGAAPIPAVTRSRPSAWLQQHPGILFLVLSSLIGLIVLPAIANALADHDVMINGRISLIDAVWLVVAVVLCIVCLAGRASMSTDLGEGLRGLIARVQTGDEAARSGAMSIDLPGLGAAIVRGIFDLAVLLVIQGIVRVPLVGVVGAFQPKALVDGAFVAIVVVIALFQLVALYGLVQPLTMRLATVGLDRLVPTAGYSAGTVPGGSPTRTITAPTSSRPKRQDAAQPTVAASAGSDLPTVAAGATVMAPSDGDSGAGEATVIEAPRERPERVDETVAQPPPSQTERAGSDERTVVAEQTTSADLTIVSTGQEDHESGSRAGDGSGRS